MPGTANAKVLIIVPKGGPRLEPGTEDQALQAFSGPRKVSAFALGADDPFAFAPDNGQGLLLLLYHKSIDELNLSGFRGQLVKPVDINSPGGFPLEVPDLIYSATVAADAVSAWTTCPGQPPCASTRGMPPVLNWFRIPGETKFCLDPDTSGQPGCFRPNDSSFNCARPCESSAMPAQINAAPQPPQHLPRYDASAKPTGGCEATCGQAESQGAQTCPAGEAVFFGRATCASVTSDCIGRFASNLPANALYVDQTASAGGDGSMTRPFNVLSDAIAAVPSGGSGTIALADQIFGTSYLLTFAAGTHYALVGGCAQTLLGGVVVSGSADVTLSNMTIKPASAVMQAVSAQSGAAVHLQQMILEQPPSGITAAIVASGGSSVTGQDLILQGQSSSPWKGVVATSGSTIQIARAVLTNSGMAFDLRDGGTRASLSSIMVHAEPQTSTVGGQLLGGSSLTLMDQVVFDGSWMPAISIRHGATASISHSLLNTGGGSALSVADVGSSVQLSASSIHAAASSTDAWAIKVEGGGSLTLYDAVLGFGLSGGLYEDGSGTSADIHGLTVYHLRAPPDGKDYGDWRAIRVSGGASMTADDAPRTNAIYSNARPGLEVTGVGSYAQVGGIFFDGGDAGHLPSSAPAILVDNSARGLDLSRAAINGFGDASWQQRFVDAGQGQHLLQCMNGSGPVGKAGVGCAVVYVSSLDAMMKPRVNLTDAQITGPVAPNINELSIQNYVSFSGARMNLDGNVSVAGATATFDDLTVVSPSSVCASTIALRTFLFSSASVYMTRASLCQTFVNLAGGSLVGTDFEVHSNTSPPDASCRIAGSPAIGANIGGINPATLKLDRARLSGGYPATILIGTSTLSPTIDTSSVTLDNVVISAEQFDLSCPVHAIGVFIPPMASFGGRDFQISLGSSKTGIGPLGTIGIELAGTPAAVDVARGTISYNDVGLKVDDPSFKWQPLAVDVTFENNRTSKSPMTP
jgi:hypothetical protein